MVKPCDRALHTLTKQPFSIEKAFDTAYNSVIKDCNSCHEGMGYGFIKLVKMKAPADQGINCTVKSEPGDVPK